MGGGRRREEEESEPSIRMVDGGYHIAILLSYLLLLLP